MKAIPILRARTASPQITLKTSAKEFQVNTRIVIYFHPPCRLLLSVFIQPLQATEVVSYLNAFRFRSFFFSFDIIRSLMVCFWVHDGVSRATWLTLQDTCKSRISAATFKL